MPNIGLVYALSAGANSIFTLVQSASSSSATSIGRAVLTPWPISERSTTMSTLLSGLIRNQALGAEGAAGVGAKRPPAGRWSPMTSPAPSAAVVSRKSRRETLEGALMSGSLRGPVDGRPDALIRAAAADVRHRGIDVGVGGVRLLGEQGGRGHDLARLAVPALRHVFRDPGALHRVGAVLGQAFDRRDALVGDRGDGQHAGACGDAVQVDGAGAALRDAAAELGARESERVAQHPEQWRVGCDVDGFGLAVDGEGNRGHDEVSSTQGIGEQRAQASREREGGPCFPNETTRGMFPGGIMTEPSQARITYARRLGIFSATMAVMGGIIGSGVFLGPEIVAARVGTAGLTLVAWIVGGIIALAGALCFGELGARRPRAGGGYVYLREAFGPLPAFLYGWALLLVIATGATAAVAVTFASYTVALLGLPLQATLPLAIGAIALLCGVHYVGGQAAAVRPNGLPILNRAAVAPLI